MRALSGVLLTLFCCFALPGFAQKDASSGQVTPPAEGATPQAPGADRRLTLDVVVTDKSGHPVPGLQQQDFTLLDDKQPQTILSFRAVDATSKGTVSRASADAAASASPPHCSRRDPPGEGFA